MPATINLCTVPGSIERHGNYATTTLEVFGESLAREAVVVGTVADVSAAVQTFGQRVRKAHPNASFLVSILIRRGDRKPKGYDATYHQNGFGQENFMHVVVKRTTPATEPSTAGAAAPASTAA